MKFMALGRNGYSLQTGLSITRVGDELFLEPINSKGTVIKARVVVPDSAIRELREVLDYENQR